MFMKEIARFEATAVAAAVAAAGSAAGSAPGEIAGPVAGLVAGTLVETAAGWLPVERLQIGTRVHTLDGGLRPVRALDRRPLRPGTPVVRIAGGHFDACSDLTLLPGQPVLLDTLGLSGAPWARVTAAELTACPGASRHRSLAPAEALTPVFDEEEAIRAHSGVLLLCPGLQGGASAFAPPAARAFVARRAALVA